MTVRMVLLTSCLMMACIRTSDQSTVNVDLKTNREGLTKDVVGSLSVYKFIYLDDKWPLSDFFSRLSSGEFSQAFEKIDLWYHPSNVDNEALQELLDKGFTPAYVRVVNDGTESTQILLSDITLKTDQDSYDPIDARSLPDALKKINPAAIAANIGNTVMTAVVVIGVVVAISAASRQSGPSFGAFNTGVSDGPWMNKTTKTTRIVYGDYLFRDVTIKPGEAAEGILFFRLPSVARGDDLQLQLSRTR